MFYKYQDKFILHLNIKIVIWLLKLLYYIIKYVTRFRIKYHEYYLIKNGYKYLYLKNINQ